MYRTEKNGDTADIIIDGWETGVATSPHKGIANLQAANISTETGEVTCAFTRVNQQQVGASGTLTRVNTNTISISGVTLLVGQVIHILVDSGTGLSGDYYYLSTGKLSAVGGAGGVPNDPDSVTPVTGINAGTATFSIYTMASPIQKATESYFDATGVQQYRYYILDSSGILWCHDTKALVNFNTPIWFVVNQGYLSGATALGILNGWLSVFVNPESTTHAVYFASTSALATWVGTASVLSLSANNIQNTFTGHQGRMYVTNGNYIASYFPDTSLVSGFANVQSYGEYTGGAATSIITTLISGSYPNFGVGTNRVPAVFFTLGTKPTAITVGTIYWIDTTSPGIQPNTIAVYAAATGGAALDMATGAVGRQFYNTFYPISTAGQTMLVFTPQRVNLPFFETAQCLSEIGNTLLIGCKGNVVYPWNQTDATPSSIISLPESNVVQMITVNQMGYIFAGNQGNVYITDGSVASLVLNVPDYVAGVPGSPGTYIESTYAWGGVMYLRGRVYFSILDQATNKAGNCGGIWSFVPTQNFYIGQDIGLALRLEAQNSYNTYNGVATLLITNEAQTGKFPLYWSAWYSSVTNPTYGIDYSNGGTNASFPAVIETDAVPVGTLLNQRTLQQIEYKLGAPLDAGAIVTAKYRLQLTDTWTALNTFISDSSLLSGYVPVNFQKAQWLQLQFTLTPITSTADTNSFVRLREIRVR